MVVGTRKGGMKEGWNKGKQVSDFKASNEEEEEAG